MELLRQDEILRDEFAQERFRTSEGKTRERTYSGKHDLETVVRADKKYQRDLKKGGK